MRNKVLALALLAMGFSVSSFAQSTSDAATATATLVAPIAISKSVDMNFGSLAASGTAGAVILGTNNSASGTGGVMLVGGTPAAAQFAVSGEGTSTFSISLPSSITLVSGLNNLTVNNFVSTPSGIGTLDAGAATVAVGATLNVPAGQAAGTYTNTTDLTVTVNYN